MAARRGGDACSGQAWEPCPVAAHSRSGPATQERRDRGRPPSASCTGQGGGGCPGSSVLSVSAPSPAGFHPQHHTAPPPRRAAPPRGGGPGPIPASVKPLPDSHSTQVTRGTREASGSLTSLQSTQNTNPTGLYSSRTEPRAALRNCSPKKRKACSCPAALEGTELPAGPALPVPLRQACVTAVQDTWSSEKQT